MTGIPQFPTDNLYKFMAIAGLTVVLVSILGPTRFADQATDNASAETSNIEILKLESEQYRDRFQEISERIRESERQIGILSDKSAEIRAMTDSFMTKTSTSENKTRDLWESFLNAEANHGIGGPEAAKALAKHRRELDAFSQSIASYQEKWNVAAGERDEVLDEVRSRIQSIQDSIHEIAEISFELAKKEIVIQAELNAISVMLHRAAFYSFVAIFGVLAGGALAIAGFTLWYRRVQKPIDFSIASDRSA